MGERIKIKKPQGADRIIVESGGAIRIQPGGVISIGAGTPINAEAATVTLAADDLAILANGDIVSFAGAVFTKAADTNTATGEFEDQAGLIACIGDMDDWAAADNSGAIDITAATDSVDFNDIDIVVSLYRVTADGVDGTVGRAGDMYADETYLYVASQDNGIGDTNWRRIALGNAYYPD